MEKINPDYKRQTSVFKIVAVFWIILSIDKITFELKET